MNQTTRLIAEKHVDFLRLDNRRNFALTESRVQHRLSFAIFARSVVGRSAFLPFVIATDVLTPRLNVLAFRNFGKWILLFVQSWSRFRRYDFVSDRTTEHIISTVLTDFKFFIFHNLLLPFLSANVADEKNENSSFVRSKLSWTD